MNLKTKYMGIELANPLMAGASPMADSLDVVRRLEDAGASAITMRSLFEEQLTGEQLATHHFMEEQADSFAEAQSYMPENPDYELGPEEYLEQLRKVKEAVGIPVFGSLNGTTPGGWLEYAHLLAEAGADGLELNVYKVATDPETSSTAIEDAEVQMCRTVLDAVDIPVAVKLSPFYTSFANFARQLQDAGAHGLVLFNRFYQADIDTEELELLSALRLSDSSALLLRLRWLAILSGQLEIPLAVTGGVHTVDDAVKAIMAGASAVQLVSVLLARGPEHLGVIKRGLTTWLQEKEYESLEQMRGSMNIMSCPDPKKLERANYTNVLQSWKGFL